jgi:hypothetical protein
MKNNRIILLMSAFRHFPFVSPEFRMKQRMLVGREACPHSVIHTNRHGLAKNSLGTVTALKNARYAPQTLCPLVQATFFVRPTGNRVLKRQLTFLDNPAPPIHRLIRGKAIILMR